MSRAEKQREDEHSRSLYLSSHVIHKLCPRVKVHFCTYSSRLPRGRDISHVFKDGSHSFLAVKLSSLHCGLADSDPAALPLKYASACKTGRARGHRNPRHMVLPPPTRLPRHQPFLSKTTRKSTQCAIIKPCRVSTRKINRRFPCKALGILIKRDVTADCQKMYCWHWRIALKLMYC